MLEKIFGSELKVKIINHFISNKDKDNSSLSHLDISRALSLRGLAWKRELEELVETGLIIKKEEDKEAISEVKINSEDLEEKNKKTKKKSADKVLFSLNKEFYIYSEIVLLFAKSRLLLAQKTLKNIEKDCKPSLMILAGKFVADKESKIDILLVGAVSRRYFNKYLLELEEIMGEEINFSILTEDEFKYRRYVMDIFLYNIIEGNNIVLVGNISDLSYLDTDKDNI